MTDRSINDACECGLSGGIHTPTCYHADCDADDMAVHGCRTPRGDEIRLTAGDEAALGAAWQAIDQPTPAASDDVDDEDDEQRVAIYIRLAPSVGDFMQSWADANVIIDEITERVEATGVGKRSGAGTGMGYRDADWYGPDADKIAEIARQIANGRVPSDSYMSIHTDLFEIDEDLVPAAPRVPCA